MMSNPYHLEMVRQGAEVWNQWRADSRVRSPELSGADLSEIDLSGYLLASANLCEANLCRADLSKADVSRGNLAMAYLIEANLFRANLAEANLVRANMAKANLFGVDLADANMSEANLSGATLTMADLTSTNVTKANLSLADLTKAHLNGTIGMRHGVEGVEDPSSVALLTPAMVHRKMDLITRDMLIGIKGGKQSEPIQVTISIPGDASYYDEKHLTNAIVDVMEVFGLKLTGNPAISGGTFFATLLCVGKGCVTTKTMKELFAGMFEEISRILKKQGPQHGLTPQQATAMEQLIGVIQSTPSQVTIQIDNLLMIQSYQHGEALIRIHQISEAVREELSNDPQMLKSSHFTDRISKGQD